MAANLPEVASRRGVRAMTETSQRPDGMTQRMVLKLLETFFRHPILHLVPLALLLGLGLFSALGAEKSYRSVGILNATSGTLLSELTGDTPAFGYETSANLTSRNVQQLIGTDHFLDDVIRRAGLSTAVDKGLVSRDEIRGSISTWAQGDNLIAVASSTPRPDESQRIAQATLDAFVEYVVSNDIADATVRIDTYEGIRDRYLAEYNEALDALNVYLEEHPAGDEEDRPVAQQLDIARLEDAVSRADDAYVRAETNVNDATLAADVARTVVSRQLRVIDEPQLPIAPLAGLRQAVLTVTIFAVLGAMLSIGIVVVTSMLDRTIRIPQDVTARFGVEVLAIVPSARR